MAKTIQNQQLTPGNIFLVRGQVGFSRLSRQTTDEERAKDNTRRTHKVDKNYTNITIYNATVLAKDPQNPTLEERYAAESCYNSSRADDYPGLNYSAMNKSPKLPAIYVLRDEKNPGVYDPITLEGELQKGTDVTLALRVFQGQGNNGISLDSVFINQESFQYYGNNANLKNALAEYGITFSAQAPVQNAVPAEDAQAAPQNVADAQQAIQPQQASQPVQQAAPQQTANPFSSFGAVPQGQPGATPFDFGAQNNANAQAQNAQNVQFGVGPGRKY